MTDVANTADGPASSAEPASYGESSTHEPAPPPTPEADERRIHLYEAVSTQRDKVLGAFDAQRAAILKTVDDQRTAALTPIMAVNAKRATQPASAPPPGRTGASGSSVIGAGGRRQLMIEAQRAVAAQIVATLKMLVAAEVRAQLAGTLQATSVPHERTQPASGNADPAVGPRDQENPA